MGAFRIRRGESLGWRDALLGLALFAAIVRSLIPAGFMPDVRDGQLSIVLCDVTGMKRVPADGEPAHDPLSDALASLHAPCAFAALATLAPPPATPLVGLPAALASGLVLADETPQADPRVPFRPQSPRAPPSLPV